jgi:hypothetical protein
MSTSSGTEVKGSEGAANKSYIRHSTSDCISGSTTSAATTEVCSCQSEWQIKEEQIKALTIFIHEYFEANVRKFLFCIFPSAFQLLV